MSSVHSCTELHVINPNALKGNAHANPVGSQGPCSGSPALGNLSLAEECSCTWGTSGIRMDRKSRAARVLNELSMGQCVEHEVAKLPHVLQHLNSIWLE